MYVEDVSPKTVKAVAERVANMGISQIDDFWSKCGWSEEDKGSNRALSDEIIEWIKSDASYREGRVATLIQESGLGCVLAALEQASKG